MCFVYNKVQVTDIYSLEREKVIPVIFANDIQYLYTIFSRVSKHVNSH